jgi:uncharacterized membrane protein (UPF0182 family)
VKDWERFKGLDKYDRRAVVVSLLYSLVPLSMFFMAIDYLGHHSRSGYRDSKAEAAFLTGVLWLIPLVAYWIYRYVAAKKASPVKPPINDKDLYAELTKLGDLKERGLLTEEEFLEQKKVILDRH